MRAGTCVPSGRGLPVSRVLHTELRDNPHNVVAAAAVFVYSGQSSIR